MRILLTGINGQVGFELQKQLVLLDNIELIALTREQLDLSDSAAIHAVLALYQPSIIINPAAYTAVDKAETDMAQAMAVNANAPKILAKWAGEQQALLIHYSTDYVFDGTKTGAYLEEDATNPQSVYGKSKLLGEQSVRLYAPQHIILRTSWVFGSHGNNFIKTILRLAQERDSLNMVADQYGAPTSAALIALVTTTIVRQYIALQHISYGTYHLTASGETTWYDYAQFILDYCESKGVSQRLSRQAVCAIPTSAYPVPAKRPLNSRLLCHKLNENFNVSLPSWHEDVSDVLSQLLSMRVA